MQLASRQVWAPKSSVTNTIRQMNKDANIASADSTSFRASQFMVLTIELRCAVNWRPVCHRKLGDRPRHPFE